MKQAALLSALLAVFSFSSAQACDWMKNSTRVNYANKVENTEQQQVAEQAPVVELEKGKEVVSVTATPASVAN